MQRMLAVSIVLLALGARAGADDPAALRGMKDGRIVYDITEGDGKLLLGRLDAIEETRQDLIRQGVTPHFVISFRGGATNLVQTDMARVKPQDQPFANQIATTLAKMGKEPGVDSIEQCSVAIRHAGTKAENVLPPIKVVGNSFVTVMAYQNKGYAYIRP